MTSLRGLFGPTWRAAFSRLAACSVDGLQPAPGWSIVLAGLLWASPQLVRAAEPPQLTPSRAVPPSSEHPVVGPLSEVTGPVVTRDACAGGGAPTDAATLQLSVRTLDDRVEVTQGDRPVGTFVFRDARMLRPHWANLFGPGGTRLTRNYPPVEGTDATDHADIHSGVWLAFGDLSGHDFWRNKARIEHREFTLAPRVEAGRLRFATRSALVSAQGEPVGELLSRHELAPSPFGWLLAWQATLQATQGDLKLGDQEEMGFGARVASDLTEKQHGQLRSATGLTTAKATWGQPADWCDYADQREPGRGVLLVPSPRNFRPSWWHNRDYGVFVANPFGRAAMKQGPPSVVTVPQGEQLTLLFGAVLHDGPGFDPAAAAKAWISATETLAPGAR